MSTATITPTAQLLTHSRQDTFKTCRKRHWFAYEIGMRRTLDAKALRMGSAYHAGLETLGHGKELAEAVYAAREAYGVTPEGFDDYEWQIEAETVVRLLCGYQWRWQNDGLEYVASEQVFELPLLNPATGKPSKIFSLAGKIDGIVRLEDGRLAVKESKTSSDDIGSDSDLWRRLRIDHQISLYIVAARRLGYPVDAVLYDVTRKPTIKPCKVPILDDLGAKVVLNQFGDRVKTDKGLWRQTGDKERNYTLQERPMTPEEWGDKLNNDIAERPEFYFARVEVPRLDQDLDEYQRELWDIQKTIREAQRGQRWYRTCNRDTCSFCYAFGPCTSGWKAGDPPPDGFEYVENVNPELEN